MNHKFCIITTAYKCKPYIDRCLSSILSQQYDNYSVCVVDDFSRDKAQENIISKYNYDHWTLIFNKERRGAMANQVMAINEICEDPEDVIVFLDGDDSFTHSEVLPYLDQIYSSDPEIELTYGSYQSVPHSNTCPSVRPYPESVIQSRGYRKFTAESGIYFNHLRTFKYKLFLEMDEEVNFKDASGKWFGSCTDTAMMIPALEIAAKHKFISEVLVDYSSDNPISDWRVNPKGIDKNHDYILNTLKPIRRSVS